MRNPWQILDLDFNWGVDSKLWTEKIKEVVQPDFDSKDSFFMSYEDFVVNFDLVHICMVDKFQEIQTKGVFRIFGMDHLFITKGHSMKSIPYNLRTRKTQNKLSFPLQDQHHRRRHRTGIRTASRRPTRPRR